jgi:hypothetical protein
MIDLAELERLAREADDKSRQLSVARRNAPWWDAETLVRLLDCYEADAQYIAACPPDLMLRLLAIARTAAPVAFSNWFDAALPDKIAALRSALHPEQK